MHQGLVVVEKCEITTLQEEMEMPDRGIETLLNNSREMAAPGSE